MIESVKTKKSLSETCERFIGQQVAVLAARYQYRGVLSEVHEDHLILANATSVEVSGPCASAAPQVEDPIGRSLVISFAAVEIFYQPNWALAPLPTA